MRTLFQVVSDGFRAAAALFSDVAAHAAGGEAAGGEAAATGARGDVDIAVSGVEVRRSSRLAERAATISSVMGDGKSKSLSEIQASTRIEDFGGTQPHGLERAGLSLDIDERVAVDTGRIRLTSYGRCVCPCCGMNRSTESLFNHLHGACKETLKKVTADVKDDAWFVKSQAMRSRYVSKRTSSTDVAARSVKTCSTSAAGVSKASSRKKPFRMSSTTVAIAQRYDISVSAHGTGECPSCSKTLQLPWMLLHFQRCEKKDGLAKEDLVGYLEVIDSCRKDRYVLAAF
jgi:hypothetical protein